MYEYKKLRGEYTLKLYELLYRHRKEGTVWYSLADFMYIMDVPETYVFKDLSKQIKKWKENINDKTSLHIDKIEQKRKGRVVDRIGFVIEEKDQLTLPFEENANPVQILIDKNKLKLSPYGIEKLSQYPLEAVQDGINKYKLKYKSGNFKGNALGYIEKCAQNYVGFTEDPLETIKGSTDTITTLDPLEKISHVRGIGLTTLSQQCKSLKFLVNDNGLKIEGPESDIEYFKKMYGDTAISLYGNVDYQNEKQDA